MTETKPKRRWFRFSLRTLLVVVTVAAVASWAYWFGWPWWKVYREQHRFEVAARQLRIGTSYRDLDNLFAPNGVLGRELTSDIQGRLNAFSRFDLSSTSYFVCLRYSRRWPKESSQLIEDYPCTSVMVFRVPRPCRRNCGRSCKRSN